MNNLITFEGGEGTGKSTHIKLLYESINKVTKKVILTREPGGTKFSEKIREILVNKNSYDLDPLTALLLINAARNEHIKKIIKPEIKKKIILCDRYIDSTYAYQIVGEGLKKENLDFLNKIVVNKVIPKITYLIDLDPKIGVQRSLKNKRKEVRFEKFGIRFHNKVRKAFLILSKNNKRICVIDGTKKIFDIHKIIVDSFNKLRILDQKIPYTKV